jgi:hypothetical protein
MNGPLIKDQRGMGLVEMILWAGFIALIGWAIWQLVQHPESFQSKPAGRSSYEDGHP